MVIKWNMACSLGKIIVFAMREIRINSRFNCLINANENNILVVSSDCDFIELSKVPDYPPGEYSSDYKQLIYRLIDLLRRNMTLIGNSHKN